jgi:hypothetical protein
MEAIDASVIFGSASRQNPAKKSRLALLTVDLVLKGIGSSFVHTHAGSPPANQFFLPYNMVQQLPVFIGTAK